MVADWTLYRTMRSHIFSSRAKARCSCQRSKVHVVPGTRHEAAAPSHRHHSLWLHRETSEADQTSSRSREVCVAYQILACSSYPILALKSLHMVYELGPKFIISPTPATIPTIHYIHTQPRRLLDTDSIIVITELDSTSRTECNSPKSKVTVVSVTTPLVSPNIRGQHS
ncbi:hypothetical protein GGR55DRAFT_476534 [Xylaria sp. FL0064]|nr:hypothetical protein GGR55DRAFT_476534 [Xylaria sp. FL0064]